MKTCFVNLNLIDGSGKKVVENTTMIIEKGIDLLWRQNGTVYDLIFGDDLHSTKRPRVCR